MKLVRDGHVSHDGFLEVFREERRTFSAQFSQNPVEVSIDLSQAPFLKEDLCETMLIDHVLKIAVHLSVTEDTQWSEGVGVQKTKSPSTALYFLAYELDHYRVCVDHLQSGIRSVNKIFERKQLVPIELEERDILARTRSLEWTD